MRPATTLVMLLSFAITALEVHALNLEYDPSLFTRGGSRGTTAKPKPKSKDVAQAPKVPLPDSRSKSRLKSSSIFEEDIVGHELPLPGPKTRAPALPASNKLVPLGQIHNKEKERFAVEP
ncbi:hypothetical protein BJ165DRAFT_1611714 [Panaeolus papilionaceus]|nr:hypothetical protein BJ165DRAFT_1611714 [Panaeolus papilionaceus]